MKKWILQELRDINKTISGENDAKSYASGSSMLIDTVRLLIDYSDIARKEGLLSLEEAVGDLTIQNYEIMKDMILLVVDGTEPELVEDISSIRYFSEGFDGFDALQYLLILIGVLAIQSGENPRIIEEKLKVILPRGIREEYIKQEKAKKTARMNVMNNPATLPEYVFEGGIVVGPDEEYYFLIKVADYAIRSLSNNDMQRLLREVDNNDLEVALMGVSGEARRRVITNVSQRLAVMLIEDMDFMGKVRLSDVAAAISKVFSTLIKLLNCGEIDLNDRAALDLFKRIFAESNCSELSRVRSESRSEMMAIMREYLRGGNDNRVLCAPWNGFNERKEHAE